MLKHALWIVLLLLLPLQRSAFSQSELTAAQLRESFAHPPDNSKLMMRWWWFGPAVTKPEISKELQQMKAAGIGGIEIATLYPLALDDPQTAFHNLTFLSDEHIEALRYAAQECHRLGMRIDITLTSGWPFGGPHISVNHAAGRLRVETISLPAASRSIMAPALSTGERLIAAFEVVGSPGRLDFKQAKSIPLTMIENGRLGFDASATSDSSAVFFISSRTGMTVKRAAVGAEGFVLDHYDPEAIAAHLHAVGDRMMQAFGDNPPYAVFSDSLEVEDSDWTDNLPEEFRKRRGYDLMPHLLSLAGDVGPETAAVRRDWGRTLTELADEHYLMPLHEWAQKHRTLLRSQTYGTPPATLASNRYADLPEGEGKATTKMWRQFSDLRWAASAGHLFDKPVISSEVWTWLHSPAFRATPLDMKAEADLHFLQGINQLVGHGWPYSPPGASEPGWRMYAAGAFNAHNPWWFAMPDLSAYVQRVSFALRQGKPANDVALLLPNDDAWARFKAGNPASSSPGASIDDSMQELLGKDVIPQVLDAGFSLDFIDADVIDTAGIPYRVLILPGIERIPLQTYKKIERFAAQGGLVIATRRLPSLAPGLMNSGVETSEIEQLSRRMFRDHSAKGLSVQDEAELGHTLASHQKSDVLFTPSTRQIGFIHRHLSEGDLYFVANTSNVPQNVRANFRSGVKFAEWWDPFTGQISRLDDPSNVALSLRAYESRLIFFSNSPTKAPPLHSQAEAKTIDLSADWNLTFAGVDQHSRMSRLHSWADDEPFKYYSGQVAYEKTIELPSDLAAGAITLDFGAGTPLPIPDPLPEFNMQAYIDSPVREAAEVFVNGQRAGVVWHPPYTIDVTSWMKAGKNDLRIVVGNTAINSLAGRARPDYRLLNDRYGERFIPQGMDHLEPIPSGILSGVWLRISARATSKQR